MDLEEIGVNTRNWVDLAHDSNYWRVPLNAALNLRGSISDVCKYLCMNLLLS